MPPMAPWATGPDEGHRKTLAQRRFDEIILSTLPPGISRWFA
jgi:hypothetical protein